eukprot:1141224-Prymnesium_polylepis.1
MLHASTFQWDGTVGYLHGRSRPDTRQAGQARIKGAARGQAGFRNEPALALIAPAYVKHARMRTPLSGAFRRLCFCGISVLKP